MENIEYYNIIKNIEIYGFMGNLGEGKNYIAEEIFVNKIKEYNDKSTLIMAFADHLKINGICFNNLEYDKVFIKKDTETRKKLQEIGTELGRDKYGKDIWIKIVYNWIKLYVSRGIKRFIITDVRFENEVQFIKHMKGVIIRIYAPDRNMIKLQQESNNDINIINKLANHPSEIFVKNYKSYDYLIDNRISEENTVNKQILKIIERINN